MDGGSCIQLMTTVACSESFLAMILMILDDKHIQVELSSLAGIW